MNRNSLVLNSFQKSEVEAIRFIRSQTWSNLQPFVGDDSSAGMEYELQVAVEGNHEDVDLPITIKNSNYYKNIFKRSERGDLSSNVVDGLEKFLYENKTNVWENSWVRFKEKTLSQWTRTILATDFLADKKNANGSQRSDVDRFYCQHKKSKCLRLPISYLLKLSLADCLSKGAVLPAHYAETGKKLLDNLVSDNTSPEILSFTIPRASDNNIGDLAAAETARTYMVSQL